MANEEHLKILEQGVEAWNKWRKKNPEVIPDLNNADLGRVNLRGANFRQTDLRGADLRGANLRGCNLEEAGFTEANLCGVDFSEAELNGASIEKAFMGWKTILADVNLGGVYGLETVRHRGPSSIGIDTLHKSKGNIPEVFLKGCGVPDTFIEYARSLTANPIEYYSCFVSYSSKDEEFAKQVHNDLQAAGVRCWLACEDMKIGDEIRNTIDASIRVHDKLLIILSESSVESEWVKDEVEHAIDLEKERKQSVLFPVRVDDTVMDSKTGWAAKVSRQRYIGDFTRWKDYDAYKKAFERLLQDLKAEGKIKE